MASKISRMPDRRVLITGSSRGIGKAIAVRLANDGWSVALHCSSVKGDAEKVRKIQVALAKRMRPRTSWAEAFGAEEKEAAVA